MGSELRMSMGPSSEPDREPRETDDFEGEDFTARERPELPRRDTLIRIGLTLLFALILSVVETLLAVVVIFELLVALVTEKPPSKRVREFANSVIAYYYRVGRYLSYNESRVPFPFDELPEPLEPDAFDPLDSESRMMGIEERS